MDSAADRKSIRAKEKEARLAARRRHDVIRSIMSTSEGRAWLWDTLSSCHIFSSTFNGDALQSAFNEGQRATGLAILSDILTACPDQYIQAQREHNERSTLTERRSGPEPDRGNSGREASADPNAFTGDTIDPGDPTDAELDAEIARLTNWRPPAQA